ALAEMGFALAEEDLRGLSEAEREQAVNKWKEREALERFDLAKGPLIRGRLLQLGEEEHLLLMTQHHIISDGWSLGLLVGEVRELYGAFRQGQSDPLRELDWQYADYAVWQRERLQGAVLEEQLGFWKEHLAGAPALLELPVDRARPPVQSYAGERLGVRLSRDLTRGLRELGQGQGQGVTLFMVLLSGWAVLLSRLSGQAEVVIGTPVANRQRREWESLLGFFV